MERKKNTAIVKILLILVGILRQKLSANRSTSFLFYTFETIFNVRKPLAHGFSISMILTLFKISFSSSA